MSDRVAKRPLPADWETLPLGSAVSRITRRNNVGNRNVLTISARDGLINQEQFFNKRVASTDLAPYFLLARGDFAYNKSYSAGYPVGVVRRLDRYSAGVVSPLYICFRPNPRIVDSDYLVHYLQSGLLDDDISWIAKEGARNHGLLNVGINDFLSIPIRLPSLSAQTCIAEILDSADETIRSTERLIAKLELAGKGLFRDLLSRGIDDSGRLRDPHRDAQDFIIDHFGPRPSTWRRHSFGELAAYVNGNAFDIQEWTDTGYPIIRIQNLNGSANFNFYNGPVASDWLVQAGDLLFAWSGTRTSSFGPTVWAGPQGVLNQHIFKVYEDKSIVSRSFLYALLNHNLERIAESAHGFKDSFVHVKRAELTSVVVNVPPIDEQQRIMRVADSADRLIGAESLKLKRLRLLKAGLMDDLLTGRVRVERSG